MNCNPWPSEGPRGRIANNGELVQFPNPSVDPSNLASASDLYLFPDDFPGTRRRNKEEEKKGKYLKDKNIGHLF